jgi:hypothetical protein
MVCFQTKNPNLGKIVDGLAMERVGLFYGHLVCLKLFGIFYGHFGQGCQIFLGIANQNGKKYTQ